MRQHNRITFRSLFRIKVSLRENGALIGYAGDISEGGLRLLADKEIAPGTALQLSLRMRDRFGEMRSVDIDVLCQWCTPNPRTGHIEVGLALSAESPAFVQLLTDMRIKAPAASA
jgi:hypothetical protein